MNVRDAIAEVLNSPPLKLRASGAGLGTERTFEFATFALVDRRVLQEIANLLAAPMPTLPILGYPDLRLLDGKNHETGIIPADVARKIIAEIDRLRDLVENRDYVD